ncbi:MAG: hypothetical protein WKG01_01145 [Kofleriaceae bacterium]
MHRTSLVAGLAVLAGCAQLAGLDTTTDERTGVSLGLERVSIGATVIRTPADLTGEIASYLVPDQAAPTGYVPIAATAAGGTFSADIRSATPPVRFTLPGVAPELFWQYPNAHLLGDYALLEHPNATPAPMGATVTATLTLDTPYVGELIRVYTVGAWAYRDFAALELPAPATGVTAIGPVAFPFASMNPLNNRPLERLTAADAVLVLRYVSGTLLGALDLPGFDQTGTDTITGALTSIAQDRAFMADLDPPAAVARFSAARPAVPTISMAWHVFAAPGYALHDERGPQLNAAAIPATDPAAIIPITYGNPFVGRDWKAVFNFTSTATRIYTPPSAGIPVTLAALMVQRTTDPTGTFDVSLPAGLPELITLDGRSLSTDGIAIPKPTRTAIVTFVPDSTTNSLYFVQVNELVPNAETTALTLTTRLVATGLEPRLELPPDAFEPGKLYSLRAGSMQGGFPNLAMGDVRLGGAPFAIAFLDSGVIQVMP